jgi:hypothetical protein
MPVRARLPRCSFHLPLSHQRLEHLPLAAPGTQGDFDSSAPWLWLAWLATGHCWACSHHFSRSLLKVDLGAHSLCLTVLRQLVSFCLVAHLLPVLYRVQLQLRQLRVAESPIWRPSAPSAMPSQGEGDRLQLCHETTVISADAANPHALVSIWRPSCIVCLPSKSHTRAVIL